MNLPTTTAKRLAPRLALPALTIAGILSLAGWSSASAATAHAGAAKHVAQSASGTAFAVTNAPLSPAVVAAMQSSDPQSMVADLVVPAAYGGLNKVDRVLWSIAGPTAGMPSSEWQQTGMVPIVVTPTVPTALRGILQRDHGKATTLGALPDALRSIPRNTIVVVTGYSSVQANTAVAEVRSHYRTVPVLELYIPQLWPQKYTANTVDTVTGNLVNYQSN